jgi:hypothetical protein
MTIIHMVFKQKKERIHTVLWNTHIQLTNPMIQIVLWSYYTQLPNPMSSITEY